MADRRLLDPQLAASQLLKRSAKDIRALSKRAYQGSLRSASLAETIGAFGVPQALISVDVSSGRWAIDAMVLAEATQTVSNVYTMSLIIGGLESGGDLTVALENPFSRAQVPGTGAVRLPILFTGDFKVDEAVKVTLRVDSVPALSTAWRNVRLRLTPF